jgi:DNA-binding NarL/FixJ family response regulator
MKVLLVDDSAAVRHHLIELLSTLPGVEILEAAQASEARHAIRSGRPDVVVLDIHMPRGSGIEVLEALREDDPRPTTIMLTNDPTPQSRAACFRIGADFFFDKTAEFQQAVDVIARLAQAAPQPDSDKRAT